jgi:hypothetical protein
MPTPQGETPAAQVFRREMLERFRAGAEQHAPVLYAPQAWLRWAFRWVVAVALAGAAFLCVATVDEYATGPCVIREIQPTTGGAGDHSFRVVMALPGHYRPMLKGGLPLRVEVSGYQGAYQGLTLASVSDRVLSAEEIRRTAGDTLADALNSGGPFVLADAPLPPTFTSRGRSYAFFDGMRGTARTPVRRSSALAILFPWVRAASERGD